MVLPKDEFLELVKEVEELHTTGFMPTTKKLSSFTSESSCFYHMSFNITLAEQLIHSELRRRFIIEKTQS